MVVPLQQDSKLLPKNLQISSHLSTAFCIVYPPSEIVTQVQHLISSPEEALSSRVSGFRTFCYAESIETSLVNCRHILDVHLAHDPEPGVEMQSLAQQSSHFLLAVSIRFAVMHTPQQ